MLGAFRMRMSNCFVHPASKVHASTILARLKVDGPFSLRPAVLFRCAKREISTVAGSESETGIRAVKIGALRSWRGMKGEGKGTRAYAVFQGHSTFVDAVERSFLRKILSAIIAPYLQKNPTAASVLDLIREHEQGPLVYDHVAFRTFAVDGCGINSIGQIFLDLGYEARDELRFPARKLRAIWFSPPDRLLEYQRDGLLGPLPRIFISELLVDELTADAQQIIRKYTSSSVSIAKHAALASASDSLTWPLPDVSDYQRLASESEYAAWTLVNGYALNHVTVSVHRLQSNLKKIDELNLFLTGKGIKLNTEGSILKVSPDGGLQQSSTVADTTSFTFAGGESKAVPGSYIEFAERLVLPEFRHLDAAEVYEWHRRDGFEVGNADKIFESTSVEQIGLQAS